MNENQKATTVGAIMLVAGGLIGAGLGLLYAPQTGKKTRRQLGRYGRQVRTEAEAMVRDSADAVHDAMENLSERTGDLVDRGGEVAEEWRKHLMETLENGQKSIDRQRQKLAGIWK
jgi:gas vesicle protein